MDSGAGKHILVVDDDDTLRETLAYDFERKGFRVSSAASGRAALELVKRERIDAIVTDIRMPDGDGVELLDRVKELNARLPVVIFITGFADLTLEDAYAKGASMVMSKPFDRKRLLEGVRRCLRGPEDNWVAAPAPEATGGAPEIRLEFAADRPGEEAGALRIGQGGMRVEGDGKPGLDERVGFRIAHPARGVPALIGEGVVRWTRKADSGSGGAIGIEFLFIEEPCREAVFGFVRRLNGKAFIPKD